MNHRTRLSEGRYRACGFAGLILFLASLLGFLGMAQGFLELFSHFRVQYFFRLTTVA